MKTHTSAFKENIKQFGRELDSKITYQLNGSTVELGKEELNSITPHYESALLKSTMKQLDVDSNVEIPEGTIINYQFGVKVGNSYEYINYGNYIVYSVEKQEDTNSYLLKCYDKMLYAMKDYENPEITYPITVREYINTICTKLGLTFKNASEQFVNYNKQIPEELYLSTEGTSLGYTYRDVLDQLAEVTASTICINEADDELEIRYVKDAGAETEATGSSITITNGEEAELTKLEIEGKTTQATTNGNQLVNMNDLTNSNATHTFANNTLTITSVSGTYNCVAFNILEAIKANPGKALKFAYESVDLSNFTGNNSIIVQLQLTNNGTNSWPTLASKNTNSSLILNSITIPNDTSNITRATIRIFTNNSNTANSDSKTIITKPLIYLENNNTYEPYTNGPSPNPEYPQEIISTGYKNLFNKNTTDKLNANFANSKISSSAGERVTYIKCKPNTTYSLYKILPSSYKRNSIGTTSSTPELNTAIDDIKYSTTSPVTITTNSTAKYIVWLYWTESDPDYTEEETLASMQIEEGNKSRDYIPYGKYGIKLINKNKNLYDPKTSAFSNSNASVLVEGNKITITTTATTQSNNIFFVARIPEELLINGATYTISSVNVSGVGRVLKLQLRNKDGTYANKSPAQSVTYNDTYGLYVAGNIFGTSNTDTIQAGTTAVIKNIQVEKGSQATTFEEFNNKSQLFVLDEPLRSIGNTKDKLFIKNGYLYVERKIGSVVLNGSESGWSKGSYTFVNNAIFTDKPQSLCSHFTDAGVTWTSSNEAYRGKYTTTNATAQFKCMPLIDMTLSEFKTWLSNNNIELQYVLAESTIENLGPVETPETYKGITYINTTDDLDPTINIKYISSFDEIDEEYLKDVNVNFGEKFGPLNTVILSRSGGSDKTAQSIPEDIADEDKIAIEISENQIMNDNNRADFIPEILKKLNGIEYYINDFVSTGIGYYNLCDRYRVKVFDNSYKCIMLNNEVDITQGLQEYVYTDKPEETETEYKYTSTDDRKINQTYIIAKKNEGTIEAVVEAVNGDDGLAQRVQRVETKQTATDLKVNVIGTHIDETTGDVRELTTTTGFTFNAEGITIEDSGSNFKAQHKNDGTYYKDGNTIVGQYTKDGSKQKDLDLFGVYTYGKNDINEIPMFIAQLFTDGNGEECFGHFYNRGD